MTEPVEIADVRAPERWHVDRIADEFVDGFDGALGEGMISPADESLLHVTDDPAEAVHVVVDAYRSPARSNGGVRR